MAVAYSSPARACLTQSSVPSIPPSTFAGPSKEEGKERELVTRGLFIGDDAECFFKAAALSIQVNRPLWLRLGFGVGVDTP